MDFTEEQIDAMSDKVARVLAQRLGNLSKGQKASLEHALCDVLDDHNGDVSTITDDEIWGAWNVMQAFYPDDVVELLEHYHPTSY